MENLPVFNTLMATIVGAAVAYLRLYVGQRLSELENLIMEKIDKRYPKSETMHIEIEGIKRRLVAVEDRQERQESRRTR